jgi:hypothetical protein
VIKRVGEAWQTLPALPAEIELLYCVRHPFDSLTSTHPMSKHERRFHITEDRWIAEYQALHALRSAQPGRRIFYLRYEDLVHEPDRWQQAIARHFGLRIKYKFSENPDGMDIFTHATEKWRTQPEYQRFFRTFAYPYRVRLREFCNEFDYILPADFTKPWRYFYDRVVSFGYRPGPVRESR